MPITTMTISVKKKKRFWLMPVIRILELAARLGIFKQSHIELVAQYLAYRGVKILTERHPS